ncbi:MAG: VWA domain-containing protein [Bacteroidota bacterium]
MFRFEQIEHLTTLGVIPVLMVFFILMMLFRRRTINRFGEHPLVMRLMPELSKYKHAVKFSVLMAALIFLSIAYANPQWGTKKEKVKRKSADIFIALDISQSMYAQDISPNRMERAKQFTQKLVTGLKGERIGLIIFAGNAYLQMPLTTDYAAASLFIKSADPTLAPTQGTAIAEAIDLAMESFDESNKFHKALIIISDGENHEADAIKTAADANDNGLLTFTIGVGTNQGGPIPVTVNGRSDYKTDRAGQIIHTRLNESMMREIADAGKGKYYNISNGDRVIESMRERIDKLEKQEFEQRTFSEYESYFQYFLAFGILLLIVEFLLSYRKTPWLKEKDIFKT